MAHTPVKRGHRWLKQQHFRLMHFVTLSCVRFSERLTRWASGYRLRHGHDTIFPVVAHTRYDRPLAPRR